MIRPLPPGWTRPVEAEGNERRLAWFTDDELAAELCRRTPVAAEGTDELREALADVLDRRLPDSVLPEERDAITDALLAGPLAPLLAKLRAVEALAGEAVADTSRTLIRWADAGEAIRRALDGTS